MLLRALPAEARLSRLPGDEVAWSTDTELLARLVEEVSVLAADKRRKKPLEVPRPRSVIAVAESSRSKVRGLRGLTQFAAEQGRVRHG